jgi:hypothetical protein
VIWKKGSTNMQNASMIVVSKDNGVGKSTTRTRIQGASVVTDPKNPQVVNNGGPADIQSLVAGLGANLTVEPTCRKRFLAASN